MELIELNEKYAYFLNPKNEPLSAWKPSGSYLYRFESVKTRPFYGFISDPLGFDHLSTKYGKLKKKYTSE